MSLKDAFCADVKHPTLMIYLWICEGFMFQGVGNYARIAIGK